MTTTITSSVITAREQTEAARVKEPQFHLPRSLHVEQPIVESAEGLYINLKDGKRILDASSGASVAPLGHSDPRVLSAITAQLSSLTYANTFFFSHEPGERLARRLCASTNYEMTRAYFVGSGSEAMEATLKMARQYYVERGETQRTKFIARRGSYHGITLGALGVSGHAGRRAIYEPILSQNVSFVSPCHAYRHQQPFETDIKYVARLAEELESEFARVGPENVCAFICEPVVGNAIGCAPALPGYLAAVKEICKKHGALLILDEVMCGMGRVGSLHAWQSEDVVPDLQTIGKGLGGGYVPLAGLLIGKEVVKTLEGGTGAFSHGHTFQGHALACAAADKVQQIVEEDRLIENVRPMGYLLEHLLREHLGGHRNVGDIRGKGLFWAIEFVKDKKTKESFEVSEGVAWGVSQIGLEEYGISLYPGVGTGEGCRSEHVIVSPPFIVTEEDIEVIVDLTVGVVEAYFKRRERQT